MIAKMEQYDDSSDNLAQNSEAIVAGLSARADVMNNALDFELVAAKERMDEIDYDFDDGATLAEFFAQDASVFYGDGIRNLYPIVASLSAGQLAGLDFLSLQDLVTIATADETSYDLNELGDVAPASIYEGVNREIFTTGKVALTSEALRAEAMKNDAVSDSPISATTYVLYGATAIATIGMVASWYKFKQLSDLMQPTIKLRDAAFKTYEAAALGPDKLYDQLKVLEWFCGKIDAVALSAGPGSYTGLRIGTSLCKGLAYGRNIPMVAVPTLDILTEALLEKTQEYAGSLLCPMLDARRMEVYTALYESDGRQIRNVEAKVIDGESFADIAPDKQMVFFGNGAMKCGGVIRRENSKFVPDIVPLARAMWRLATERLQRGETVDIAYFEPFYLKDFVAAPSHVKGLK